MKKMKLSFLYNINFWGLLLVGIGLANIGVAQPIISALDKTTGSTGEEVSISGLNLPTGADLKVYFGAEEASVVSSSANLIVVQVPAGATYGPISVTNLSDNLTGYSSQHFLLSFSGSNGTFSAATRFGDDGSSQPFDLAAADFDGDGDVDIILTNDKGNKADLFTNDGTNPVSFTVSTINTGGLPSRNMDAGDIDGDGLPDLVMTRGNNGNSFSVFENTSGAGITFGAPVTTDLPDIGENVRIARRPIIQDLDGDGKPELIVSNESDATIHIYVNESTGANDFTFNTTPVELVATGSTVGLSGLAAKDLNNDGFPEVIANAFINSPNLFVFRNVSSPGSLEMLEATIISAPSGQVNLEIGDFDVDGFNDVATTSVTTDAVLLFRNTTTQVGATITLADPVSVSTGKDAPLGLSVGDLNGDGLPDIAVGHEAGVDPEVITLINGTTGTDFSFSVVGLTSERTSRNVKIVDLNHDGRPDIAYTNDIVTDALGDLAVFENTSCIEPVITPSDAQTVCMDAVIELDATHIALPAEYASSPLTYQWRDGGVDIGGATAQTYTVPTGAALVGMTKNYSVQVSDGTCSEISAAVSITVDGAASIIPDIIVDSDACVGSNFTLTTSEVSSGYFWSGPNDFTSTQQNPTIANIAPEAAGTYSLQVEVGGTPCLSEVATTVITVQNVPQPVIFNAGASEFCAGNTVQISTPEFSAGLGLTYAWSEDGTPLAGETAPTLSITAGGNYSVEISDGTCALSSVVETLTDVDPPVSSFDAADATCVEIPLNFNATSTGEAGFTLAYAWDSGDGEVSTDANPEFTYNTAGTFSAELTTSYVEVVNCEDAATADIVAQAVPNIPITAQNEAGDDLTEPFEKCPSESVVLAIAGLNDVVWMISGQSDTLSSEDTYSTSVIGDYTAMGTDDVGCVVSSDVNLDDFAGSGLTLTSSSNIDINDEIQLEDGQEMVDFTVSGGTGYMWEPEELVDDPTGSMVIVTPFDISTVITVSGVDINDCEESRSVTILDTFVTPRTSFSPNGDNIGDCWEIPNLSGIPGLCSITVFDSRGRRLLETESPFDSDCVWDGFFSGDEVPEGVYYYAMSCEDNDFNRSGSILLAR